MRFLIIAAIMGVGLNPVIILVLPFIGFVLQKTSRVKEVIQEEIILSPPNSPNKKAARLLASRAWAELMEPPHSTSNNFQLRKDILQHEAFKALVN